MGVAARLLQPLPKGVEFKEMLAVGVRSSEDTGLSLMVRSSQEACGADIDNPVASPGVIVPTTSVLSPR